MKKIVKERQKKKMTQTDLAFELKIHPAQLSRIENGRAIPYKPNEKKLTDFFEMSIEDLLQEVE
jgi:ribosome-binding protein aMBF1 (putative translation factor)